MFGRSWISWRLNMPYHSNASEFSRIRLHAIPTQLDCERRASDAGWRTPHPRSHVRQNMDLVEAHHALPLQCFRILTNPATCHSDATRLRAKRIFSKTLEL